jgi:hypothetical protein
MDVSKITDEINYFLSQIPEQVNYRDHKNIYYTIRLHQRVIDLIKSLPEPTRSESKFFKELHERCTDSIVKIRLKKDLFLGLKAVDDFLECVKGLPEDLKQSPLIVSQCENARRLADWFNFELSKL